MSIEKYSINNNYIILSSIFAVLFYLAYLIWSVFALKAFFADGSYQFIEYSNFGVHPFRETYLGKCYARGFAHFIYFYPSYFSLNYFHFSLEVVRKLFSATLILHPLISLISCFFIIGKNRIWYNLFPLFSLAVAAITTHPFFIGEFQLTLSLVWPIACFLIFRDLNRIWVLLTSSFLTIWLSLVYEGSFPFLILLTFFIIFRICNLPKQGEKKVGYYFSLCLFVLSSSYSGHYLKSTCYPELLNNFVGESFLKTLTDFRGGCLIPMFLIFLIGNFKLNRGMSILLVFFSIVISASICVWPHLDPAYFQPENSYFNRSIVFVITGLILIELLIAQKYPEKFNFKLSMLLVSIFIIGQSGFGLTDTYYWSISVKEIRRLTQIKFGPSSTAGTKFDQQSGDPYLKKYNWSWAFPALSLVLYETTEVKGILYNPDDWYKKYPLTFKPYDPQKTEGYPNLKIFGLDYSNYLKAANQTK